MPNIVIPDDYPVVMGSSPSFLKWRQSTPATYFDTLRDRNTATEAGWGQGESEQMAGHGTSDQQRPAGKDGSEKDPTPNYGLTRRLISASRTHRLASSRNKLIARAVRAYK
jgi:hypothetical protein